MLPPVRRVLPPLAVRLALSAVLIGLLLWRIDLSQALDVVSAANFLYLLPALPLYSLSKLLDAYRWRLMLHRVGSPPVSGLFGVYLMSNMANSILPVRMGDLLRVQVPARRYGIPRAGLTASVFVTESLLDGVIFMALLLAALAFFDIPRLPLSFVWAFGGLVLVGLALSIAVSRLELGEGWQERGPVRRLPEGMRKIASRVAPEFVRGLALLKDPPLAALALAASAVAWLMETGVFALFGQTFGLELGFADYIVIMITANMIVAMPLAPSNVGPYEVAVAAVVSLLGADVAEAAAFAVGSHLLLIVWMGVTGVAATWAMGLGLGDVFFLRREKAEEAARERAEAG